MAKGHSRDLDRKGKGKTEQAPKVRAKPVGRKQLGVKMQLSPKDLPHILNKERRVCYNIHPKYGMTIILAIKKT